MKGTIHLSIFLVFSLAGVLLPSSGSGQIPSLPFALAHHGFFNIPQNGPPIDGQKMKGHGAEALWESKGVEASVLRDKTICIDPGHGGTAEIDSYRVGPTGEREEWVNLRVGLVLKQLLEERGARVVMTRTEDVQVDLLERSEIAKKAKADLFISIHHNATADEQVNFPIIYFHGSANENKAGVFLGKALARSFLIHFFDAGTPVSLVSDHVIFPKGGTSVLRGTYGIPGVLAEASFFTHIGEEERLKEENYNRKEARAYLDAIEKYFSSPPKDIDKKREPLLIPPFEVLQEAERMQPAALLWKDDFRKAKALLLQEDRQSLEKAYRLLTRSARSFPDSYVAGKCHMYRASILEKMGRKEEADLERKRVEAFFVEIDRSWKTGDRRGKSDAK